MSSEYRITNEQHLYTSDGKIKWIGYGEWVEEPDSVNIEYLGYEAVVKRALVREPCFIEAFFGGHLCGYVRIPENHPYFKKEDIYLDCHYEITFNEFHEQHWVGFDCAHSGDIIPSMEFFKNNNDTVKRFREEFPLPDGFDEYCIFNPVYRNMQYCIDTCIGMIDQLISVSV